MLDHVTCCIVLHYRAMLLKGQTGGGQSLRNRVIEPSTVTTCYWPGQVWRGRKGKHRCWKQSLGCVVVSIWGVDCIVTNYNFNGKLECNKITHSNSLLWQDVCENNQGLSEIIVGGSIVNSQYDVNVALLHAAKATSEAWARSTAWAPSASNMGHPPARFCDASSALGRNIIY